jgi:hypothetical protein
MPNKEDILRILTTKVVGKDDLELKDREIEQFLGLKSEDYEGQAIAENSQKIDVEELYLENLPALALNTSWHDIYQLLNYISSKNEKPIICDLGAGNCRLAIMAQLFFPKVQVISIEPISHRMIRAKEICHNSHHKFYANYFEEVYQEIRFDFVFLYFPNGTVFENILRKLKGLKFPYSIICIESHGEMINRLNFEKSWLKGIEILKLIAPRHREYIYEFERIENTKDPLEKKFYELFEHNGEYKISDNNGHWFASTQGSSFYFDKPDTVTIEFKSPPRTIELSDSNIEIISNCLEEEIAKHRKFLELRNQGQIRKVYESDLIELPNGKLIKKGQL